MTTEERFWNKVRKTEGCWEWSGAKAGGEAIKIHILATGWFPYSPEPEKCEACREADELEARHDFLMYPFNGPFVRHLRSHCQCKKEAP
jgi:hypothetical protein